MEGEKSFLIERAKKLSESNPHFVEKGGLTCLIFNIDKLPKGAVVFQVLDRFVGPFEYSLGENVKPDKIIPPKNSITIRLSGRFAGRDIEDLFYFDDANVLIHAVLDVFPKLYVYKYFIAGSLQADYHDILLGIEKMPWGFDVPPIEFVVIPYVHLEFCLFNPYLIEPVLPYIRFDYAVYDVKVVLDEDIIKNVLRRKWVVPWFNIYGPRAIVYDLEKRLGVAKPLKVDAADGEIRSWIEKVKELGVWK